MLRSLFQLFVRIDHGILGRADAAILWLWNTLEIARIKVLRVVVISWALSLVLCTVARTGKINVMDVVVALLILLFMALEEFNAARFSPSIQNTRHALMRVDPFLIAIRCWCHWTFFVITPIQVFVVGEGVLQILPDVLGYASVLAIYTMVPTEPPKRRQREEVEDEQHVPEAA